MKRLFLVVALVLGMALPAAAQSWEPRDPNAQAYHANAWGQVDGIQLVYKEHPDTKYRLEQATFITEAEAGGATIAKYTIQRCDGTTISDRGYLAWPFPDYNTWVLPGNQNQEHMVTNGFDPPNIGPLGLYIGKADGTINSDEIGGLGLPYKHHVSFAFTFRERCRQAVATATAIATITRTPGPTATPGPVVSGDLGETNSLLEQILAVLRALAGHLGTPGYAVSN